VNGLGKRWSSDASTTLLKVGLGSMVQWGLGARCDMMNSVALGKDFADLCPEDGSMVVIAFGA
jgi:hypothetical protein